MTTIENNITDVPELVRSQPPELVRGQGTLAVAGATTPQTVIVSSSNLGIFKDNPSHLAQPDDVRYT